MAGGLVPHTLRLGPLNGTGAANDDISVEITEDDDAPEIDQSGAVILIEHGDGSVSISMDGKPLGDAQAERKDTGWFANLAEDLADTEMGRIAEELLRGIGDDDASRKDWIDVVATGLQLLGLKIEIPGVQGASDGAPVEGMSKVRSSLLLEAVLRFQANARSELLPTDGPVKVRDDTNGGVDTPQDEGLADALEEDLNHYLTAVATEYIPDTDKMLFKLGLNGTSFKKGYFCPLRMRPVLETVDADDLIVSNNATDLQNALRVTHKLTMRPSTVKRMQLLGVYRDIQLNTPVPIKTDAAQRVEKEISGQAVDTDNPDDRDRELYECYCELEIDGYEHRWKGKPSGLPVPYRVTIDVTSREILSIVRNYDKPKPGDLPIARRTFVKYSFVPGMGFYDIGLLHIMGNTSNAITAAIREMLDNGMFANFPGFLIADTAGRQTSNLMRVPPGGGQPIKTQGMDIRAAVMALPYSTQHMPALMALIQDLKQDLMRLGGTSELQVGEGRPDAPVGTTLAMIEQATKVMNSVHKRMHAAQAEEFKMLVELFREHPDSFLRVSGPSNVDWDEQKFLGALNNHSLVPQADPNTASHSQRVMKVQALNLWAQANPTLADPIAIAKVSLAALGWSTPEQFMAPPEAMGEPSPEVLEKQAKAQADAERAAADTTRAQAAMLTAQAKAHETAHGGGLGAAQMPPPDPVAEATAKAKLIAAETGQKKLALDAHEIDSDNANRQADREAEHHSDTIDLAESIMGHMAEAEAAAKLTPKVEKDSGA